MTDVESSSVQRRRPTLEDVAAKAGVSRSMASIVMRGDRGARPDTRVRVLTAANEIGYRPNSAARRLAQETSRLIGVVYSLRRSFDADVVEQLYEVSEHAGYELSLSATTESRDLQRAVGSLIDNRCEGILMIGMGTTGDQLAEQASQVPIVQIGRAAHSARLDVVRTAGDVGTELAVNHLIGLGHRRIAYVDGGDGMSSEERRNGYLAAMRAERRAKYIKIIPGGMSPEDGSAAADTILCLNPRPTAVVAFNDGCAGGILETFQQRGVSVPGEISVVGYDNSQFSRMPTINLTSVAQDVEKIAELAVHRLVDRLGNPTGQGTEIVLDPVLVVRATTGPVA